jgi:hypothetical protein
MKTYGGGFACPLVSDTKRKAHLGGRGTAHRLRRNANHNTDTFDSGDKRRNATNEYSFVVTSETGSYNREGELREWPGSNKNLL